MRRAPRRGPGESVNQSRSLLPDPSTRSIPCLRRPAQQALSPSMQDAPRGPAHAPIGAGGSGMSAGHLQTSRRRGPKLFASEFQEMLASELTWYFAEAECASGVSSNFESINER